MTRRSLSVLVAGVVLLHAGVALVMLFGRPERWSSPTFRPAQAVLPIDAWALVFAIVGVGLAYALATRRPILLGRVAAAGAGLCSWWAVLFIVAASESPNAGLLGIVLWLSAACSHVSVAVGAGLTAVRR